jgi:CheY-like chemotaxis protein
LKQKRVLVVDDEEDLTWSISKHLAKDKDKYQLIAVNSGKAALDAMSQLPFDLVVSDIRMPEISGLDLLLKVRDNYPQTKVIIMTAYGSSEIQDEANRRGCFKYIEKPFEIHELRQFILNALEDKKGFEGRISDFQLADLIQMNCLGRLTNALHVQKSHQRGVIYFEDGNIVHASLNNVEGEEAFYEILSWEGGSFSVERNVKPPKDSIFKGWQTLLLEGLRRADESRINMADTQAPVRKPTPPAQSKLLSEFVSVKGVLYTAITDNEGCIVQYAVRKEVRMEFDPDKMTNIIQSLQQLGLQATADFGWKELREMSLEFEDNMFHLFQIPDLKGFLVAISDNNISSSLLRMEARKVIKRIADGK